MARTGDNSSSTAAGTTAFSPLACVILAAGQGTRMRSDLPKVLHPVAGWPMIRHVVEACRTLAPERIVAVIGPAMDKVREVVAPHSCAIQSAPRGTGDAAKAALPELKGFNGDIAVLFGDAALVTPEAITRLRAARADSGAAVVVGGFRPADPGAYGRLVTDSSGRLQAIVEAADATPQERAIGLCNGGIMLFDSARFGPLLEGLADANAKKEFYLTDCVKLANAAKLGCAVAEMEPEDVLGVNDRVELAEAERLMQERLRRRAMLNGATLLDPATVYFTADTKIGRDVVIGPNVVFGGGVEIADNALIRAFCHLEQTRVEKGATVGPFARLRPSSVVGTDAHIGNFVELKNTTVGAGAKINHLSYVGDASVGPKANIGAGTITCNYDGFRKARTEVGAEAFIGSNTALVAPVKVGDGAYVGAGSVITMDVPANTLAVARSRQANIEDWARRHRESNAKPPGKDKA